MTEPACDVAELNDDVIDIVAEHGRRIVSPITSVALWQMGGAVTRIGENETAFNGRSAGFTFNINGNSETADGFGEADDPAVTAAETPTSATGMPAFRMVGGTTSDEVEHPGSIRWCPRELVQSELAEPILRPLGDLMNKVRLGPA